MDNRGAQVIKHARMDLMDLKDQREGEAHIFFKSTIIRASMFYADPPHCKVMRLNQFLKVEKPEDADLHNLMQSMDRFKAAVSKPYIFPESVAMDEFLERFITEYNKTDQAELPIERAVSAIKSFYQVAAPRVVHEAIELPENEVNIFTNLRQSEYLEQQLLVTERGQFSQAILSFNPTREQTAYVERLLGKTDQYANSIASEIVKDMQMATHYPPEIIDVPTPAELAAAIDDLVANISTIKSGGTAAAGEDTSFLD